MSEDRDQEWIGENRPSVTVDDALAWGMVESSPDGMVLTDDHGVILMLNGRIEAMFGVERTELVGCKVEDLLAARHRQAHTAHRLRYRADPRPRSMGVGLDLWGCRRDGREFPVEVSLSPLTIDEQTWFVATVRDVSERRAAEAHVKLVQHTIDSAHDGVFMFTPGSLRFTYVNQGASDQLGYSQSELLTMTPLHATPEFDEAQFRSLLEPVLEEEVPSLRFTTLLRRRSGVDVPVEVVLESPEPTSSDQPRQVIAIVRDITERKRAEAERDRHRAWLEALSSIRSWLLEQGSTEYALELVCRYACDLVDASDAVIVGRNPGSSVATVVAAVGRHAEEIRRIQLSLADTALGRALAGSESLEFANAADDLGPEVARAFTAVDIGPLIGATMQDPQGEVVGVLLTGRLRGENLFEAEDLNFVRSFAHEASAAIGAAQAQANDAQLSLLEDRERIAHDLHDMVIQRLFVTGMGIQSLYPLVADAVVKDRLTEAVVELDRTISEIRSTIFRLSHPESATVPATIRSVVDGAAQALGFEPSLAITGDVETIEGRLAHELVSALSESLSNVARHARATMTDVRIEVTDEQVLLEVSDDGVGISDGMARGNGLDNLASRARRLNGSFRFGTNTNGGTTLSWVARGFHP